ncbi:sugar ABC transporter sugar-binding protein [Fimbriimonas ginsengisoli Gsoil 348]|uniref:Sugar ABC transporter sugar-binding protein n=2 Tax=Fimbriimonas ginsengisoli TaxID=1005039 RepID=A0A068NP13_FIMGI|nr:sugar ABC transporter sugar-binding protein [Fimbriimonas ginsengisoli Gsoil 348]
MVAAKPVPVAKPGEKLTGNVEVQAFKGGFGIDFYQKAADEFMAKNPDVKVKVEGDPRVWEKLRPRLVSGDTPDLMFPGWDMDHWGLVQEGQLYSLDAALDSEPYEGTGKWRDTFEPALLKLGQLNGKQYVLPYYMIVMGWWYDPGVFAKNGWTVPKTYEELLELCPKIKAKGIAPITFQGKYPYYMMFGMLLPWCQSVGGLQAINDAQNLVPGAWKSPAMLQAAKMIRELGDKGFYQEGAVGLSHTESQTEFLNGHAAMIPCGTWLESEMKNVTPPGAKMQFMLPPVFKDGKGDPSALMIDIEPWMIPSAAKNPKAAVALYKYMTSLPVAKRFVEEKGTLMAIKGSDDTKLPETLQVPAKAFHDSKAVYCYQARHYYKVMDKEIQDALTSMLNKQITPEQFCDRAEAAAEKTRKDDSIPKRKIE